MLEPLFMGVYLALFVAFLAITGAWGPGFPRSIGGMDLLLLSLATFRLTELVTGDSITRFLRDPFVERRKVRQPDGSEGQEVKPAGKGLRRLVGELIICPWCMGVWVATGLTYFLLLAPEIARVLLLALSAAAGGILLQLFAKLLDKRTD